ncbi:MAG: UbiD family decarboxylase [Chelatococcus sp.]|uniref:UbiD family decarboxylase n=1 Tax=Chelatococcus sp. TaxID=1953771 RepID=UPI0025BAA8BA|nr:UbiD family decarboxylase [Chelatococcus sp.]MBX3539451.1 UbiD family decarboxylase [Chelatococcus sp.]
MSSLQSLRAYLAELDASGELAHVPDEVSPHFELSACLSVADGGKALIFDKVAGSSFRAVGNLLSNRDRIARALKIDKDQIQRRLIEAIDGAIPPVEITGGPVQEVITTADPLAGLPVPTFFAAEAGPYITAGLIVAKDPQTGRGNASYARILVTGPATGMIGIAPNHHLAHLARKAASLGQKLEIAVVLGAHPAIQLAGCLYLGLGDDEMHCAGKLLGQPVELVRCRTVDLMVPAHAEMVLEGTIDVNTPIKEGLISEYHGMYEDYGAGFLTEFRCRTHRRDALFQVIEPGYHGEHIYLGALPIAASLRIALARVFPNVGEVAVTASGAGRNDAVVQMVKPKPGQGKRAIFVCWGAVNIVKSVTVVDEDIDPWDLAAVDRARCARMKGDRDIVIVPAVSADRSEPLEHGGLITKIGYDATAKDGDRPEGITQALPPAEFLDAARMKLRTLGIL